MNNSLHDIFIDQMVADVLEEEDRKIMPFVGLSAIDDRNVIGVVMLHHGRKVTVYEDGVAFYFVYVNDKENLIDAFESNDIFSGVEQCMSVLERFDAEILWNWFLDYGK